MAVPSVLDDLSTTAGLNAPAGGEDVFPQLDNYLRAHAAFIAQLRGMIATSADIEYQLACSDLTTALTTGTSKGYFRVPRDTQNVTVRASLLTASTSGAVTIDINVNGSTILSTKLTIDANEKTSTTAATAAVQTSTTLAADDEVTIDIDGAGTGAKGLIVCILGETV